MSFRTLLPGRAYSFLYPRHNFQHVNSGLEPRRLIVESVRDLERQPIPIQDVNSNPYLRRSRWLVTGRDLDKNAERSFYVGSMAGVVEIDPSAPSDNIPIYIVGRLRFATESEAVAAAGARASINGRPVAVAVTHASLAARKTMRIVTSSGARRSKRRHGTIGTPSESSW